MERCCAMGMGEGQYVLSQISAWDPRFLILLIILFYFNTFHPSFQRLTAGGCPRDASLRLL